MTEVEFKKRTAPLIRIFANAAVGDFSEDPEMPDEDDEITELYMGVKVMLDVIRDKLRQLKDVNEELQEQLDGLQKAYLLTRNRELRMIELKKEIDELRSELESCRADK